MILWLNEPRNAEETTAPIGEAPDCVPVPEGANGTWSLS